MFVQDCDPDGCDFHIVGDVNGDTPILPVDLIYYYSCHRLNICNLDWVDFIMINKKLCLLVVLDGLERNIRYDDHQVIWLRASFASACS